MHITIAERLKPFSHIPGYYFILPGTTLRFQLFPSLIRVHDLSEQLPRLVTEIQLDITGPVKDFTAMQDLEHGYLSVWGHATNGYMRYRIVAIKESSAFAIVIEKNPSEHFLLSCSNDYKAQKIENILNHAWAIIPSNISSNAMTLYTPLETERLSLGSHKAQNWHSLVRQHNLIDILPLWFKLGQLVSCPSHHTHQGTCALLDICRQKINEKATTALIPAFQNLFLAGFDSGLAPRLLDTDHQGFNLPKVEPNLNASPLQLLTDGAALIRSLFVQSDHSHVNILPALPPEFHCGRILNVCWEKVGKLNIEWSKKSVRRMLLKIETAGELHFGFQKDVSRFRLRKGENDRGQSINRDVPIAVEPGVYLFDNFEK